MIHEGSIQQHSNVAPQTHTHSHTSKQCLFGPRNGLVNSCQQWGETKKNIVGWRCNSILLGFWIWRLFLGPLLFLRSPELCLLPSFLAFVRAPWLGSWLGWVVSVRDDRHFDVVSQRGKGLDDQSTNVAGGPTVSPGGDTTTSQGDHQDQQDSTCKRNHKCLGKRPLPRIWKINWHCYNIYKRPSVKPTLKGLTWRGW